ncbi:hypothetical protein [Desulfofarcimen acetoxidans]|uniref:hypothetical protein n=1 Tax=Desulfofarcimen acetoxidans TaxID=58138 RepID=UPI00019E49E2|nr:hypothetical protein [Desulfofarcimen acetoxidans]
MPEGSEYARLKLLAPKKKLLKCIYDEQQMPMSHRAAVTQPCGSWESVRPCFARAVFNEMINLTGRSFRARFEGSSLVRVN